VTVSGIWLGWREYLHNFRGEAICAAEGFRSKKCTILGGRRLQASGGLAVKTAQLLEEDGIKLWGFLETKTAQFLGG